MRAAAGHSAMRSWVCALLLASSGASADDGPSIRLRSLDRDAPAEPWLHLDAATPDRADAEGGLVQRHGTALELGPRARLAAQGKWWQSGLAPSMFADDLHVHGWRAGAELSYDLGPFSVGVNASLGREGDLSHRAVGLFAYRTFRLSRWMHAWILLGVAFEQWDDGSGRGPIRSTTAGLTLGTTFR